MAHLLDPKTGKLTPLAADDPRGMATKEEQIAATKLRNAALEAQWAAEDIARQARRRESKRS